MAKHRSKSQRRKADIPVQGLIDATIPLQGLGGPVPAPPTPTPPAAPTAPGMAEVSGQRGGYIVGGQDGAAIQRQWAADVALLAVLLTEEL